MNNSNITANTKELDQDSFSQEDFERIDDIYKKTIDYFSFLTGEEVNYESVFSAAAEIADYAAEKLSYLGYDIYFPTEVFDSDGASRVERIYPVD